MGGLEKRKQQMRWRAWTSRQKLRLTLGVALFTAFLFFWNMSALSTSSGKLAEDLCAETMIEVELPMEAKGAAANLPLGFNASSPIIQMFAWRLDGYLTQWKGVFGIKQGLGSSGMIKDYTLQIMGSMPEVMACCSHVIVVDGKVYFRYGGFVNDNNKLIRLHESIKLVQAAVDKYQLRDVRVEFFLNTCRWPLSYDNAMSPMTTGRLPTVYPILSTRFHPASTDVLVPDPIDTYEEGDRKFIRRSGDPVPWDSKMPKAVFRSDELNFDLREDLWAVSPRLRLHRMTDARPDLLDARITRFGSAANVRDALKENGLVEGPELELSEKSRFKYEMVVDGSMGATTVCSVLGSSRAMIRQESEILEFFDPLLIPGVHYLPTSKYFNNLFQVIEWAGKHDSTVQKIVSEGNKMAESICSRDGRVDYWALLLLKYQKAMENPSLIKTPTKMCKSGPHNIPVNAKFSATCDVNTPQAACVFYCGKGSIRSETWEWLSADRLTSELLVP